MSINMELKNSEIEFNDFNTPIFTIIELYNAYLDCKKGKNSINACRFEFNVEENLFSLLNDLNSNAYQISRAIVFVVLKPKIREIWASDFRDRVVHHLITRKIDKYYENEDNTFSFLKSSFANRKEKGTHNAVKLLKIYSKQNKYYLKLDIKSFFNSINRNILFYILNDDLKNVEFENKEIILSLFKKIIFHKYTSNFLKTNQNLDLYKKVPFYKSLFSSEPNDCGLPIGNLTSQFLSNVYLNKLDYFIEKELKFENYIRYVDDFILFSNDREELENSIEKIKLFLKNNLKLEIHPQKIILNTVENGIDFLGFFVKPNYILVRKNVVSNLREKLYYFFKNKDNNQLTKDEVVKIQNMLNSYFGHFKHANSYNLKYKMGKKLSEYFDLEKKNNNIFLKQKYNLNFKNVYEQYLYFKNKYNTHLIIFQMGNFYRFFNGQADFISQKISLKTQIKIYSYKKHLICGFPVNSKKYLELIENLNINYVIVKQLDNELSSGLKERIEDKIVSNKNNLIIKGGFEIESEVNLKLSSKRLKNNNNNHVLILELLDSFKNLEANLNLRLKKIENKLK